jgi:hypothetical protein
MLSLVALLALLIFPPLCFYLCPYSLCYSPSSSGILGTTPPILCVILEKNGLNKGSFGDLITIFLKLELSFV